MPLLSIVGDDATREDLRELARKYHRDLVSDRGQEMGAQLLAIIRELHGSQEPRPSVKEIASWFSDRHGEEYDRKVTAHWIGSVIRKKLQIKTQRGQAGAYMIPTSEDPKLARLYDRYGLPPTAGSSPTSSEKALNDHIPELGELSELHQGTLTGGTQ